MAIRTEVQRLIDLGPFPASSNAEEADIDHREAVLKSIAPPLTAQEATALMSCFGPDEAFGLAWALLHLIETAPGGPPPASKPADSDNEWIRRLWARSHR